MVYICRTGQKYTCLPFFKQFLITQTENDFLAVNFERTMKCWRNIEVLGDNYYISVNYMC